MKLEITAILLVVFTSLFNAGCRESTAGAAASSYDGSKFLLSEEPEGGQNVIAVRDASKDGDEVVIVGRIGGSLNPWVDDRVAFSVVDPSLLACSDDKEEGESCSCQTPWDYCCETDKLPEAMALVKFVESDGSVVKHDARKVFGLVELQTVVIQGKAQRDDAGNLTILASGMYVRK